MDRDEEKFRADLESVHRMDRLNELGNALVDRIEQINPRLRGAVASFGAVVMAVLATRLRASFGLTGDTIRFIGLGIGIVSVVVPMLPGIRNTVSDRNLAERFPEVGQPKPSLSTQKRATETQRLVEELDATLYDFYSAHGVGLQCQHLRDLSKYKPRITVLVDLAELPESALEGLKFISVAPDSEIYVFTVDGETFTGSHANLLEKVSELTARELELPSSFPDSPPLGVEVSGVTYLGSIASPNETKTERTTTGPKR